MNNRDHDDGVPASEVDDLSARLRAHTRALQQNVRALQETIAAVDAAVAVSRARLFVRHRPPAGVVERRAGFERRRHDDPTSALVRWIEGEALERRSGADRRAPEGAPAGAQENTPAGAPETAPTGAPATAPATMRGNIVSLDAFRAHRARLRPRN